MHAQRGSERRFTGVARLFGDQAATAFGAAHVCVIGVGGVGSWAVEALARSGVGALTLVDLDHVAESNVNRQVHALTDTLGAAKVQVMRQRVAAIAPECRVEVVEDFLTPENARQLVAGGYSVVIDAIDQVRAKVALALACREARLPLVMCGAAGGKTDPTRIRHADLAETAHDALLSKVRARLRREHGFARTGRMRIDTVYSDQPMLRHPWGVPAAAGAAQAAPVSHDVRKVRAESAESAESAASAASAAPALAGPRATHPITSIFDAGAGLACAGYGSVVTVTAPIGFVAAARALEMLARRSHTVRPARVAAGAVPG